MPSSGPEWHPFPPSLSPSSFLSLYFFLSLSFTLFFFLSLNLSFFVSWLSLSLSHWPHPPLLSLGLPPALLLFLQWVCWTAVAAAAEGAASTTEAPKMYPKTCTCPGDFTFTLVRRGCFSFKMLFYLNFSSCLALIPVTCLAWSFLSDVSTETYSNSDNFGSSNARVSERDFWYSLQGHFLDTIEETDWQEQLIS